MCETEPAPDEVGPMTWKRHGTLMEGEEFAPIEVEAYGVPCQGGKFELMKVILPALRSTQVQVDISHCGLCHTEVHMVDNDWGTADYPLVPGHEGYGKVTLVGSDVTGLKLGDTVGIGWLRDSCGDCTRCSDGHENLCAKGYQGIYLGPSAGGIWGNHASNLYGCFSKTMRLEERFTFALPANVSPLVVCPLMCAGSTVYEPLVNSVKEGMDVAIGSIGGLGTLAIKFAKLKGATVTAISRSSAKRGPALAAGADAYVALDDPAAVAAAANAFDFMLDTNPAPSKVSTFIDMLKFGGTLCRVGIPPASGQSFTYDWIPLIFTQRTISASIVTGSANMKALLTLSETNLDFLMKNDPNWEAQERPFDEVNEAVAELKAGQNKGFRTVLKW